MGLLDLRVKRRQAHAHGSTGSLEHDSERGRQDPRAQSPGSQEQISGSGVDKTHTLGSSGSREQSS